MIERCLAILLLLISSSAFAQDRTTPLPPLPLGDILLTLPTTHMPDAGTVEIRFSHRFNQSVDEGEAVHSLFGLDSGANVGIGLSWVPRRDLQLAFLRSNVLDTFDLSIRYLALQQAPAMPVSLALRGGAAIRTERDTTDRSSYYAQAIVSRQFGDRFALYAMPTLVTDAGRGATAEGSGALFQHAFNVPLGAAVMIRSALSAVVELIPPNGDLPDDLSADLGWAVGIKRALGGHLFEILLTNSNALTTDQYVTSTYQGVPLRSGDLRVGFNIERRFGRR